jgi:hypothetical protein
MKSSLPDWLIVCIWRALIGEIYPSIRAIAIEHSKAKRLTIRYYLDREVNEMDSESIEVVATNISAAGYDEIDQIAVECEYPSLSLPIGEFDNLDGFIFCRREYD